MKCNNSNISRRKALQIGGSVGAIVSLSGCLDVLSGDDKFECTDSNAVLYFPHNLFIVTVTGDGTNNATTMKNDLLSENYHAETRPTINVELAEQEVERGDGFYLILIGDFTEEKVEELLVEYEVDYTDIKETDGIMQRLVGDFPNYSRTDILTKRFEYVTEELKIQAGLDLPTMNKSGNYIEIVDPESDGRVNEIKSIFEPRGNVEFKLSSQSLGDGVITFKGDDEELIPVGFGSLSEDEWRVDKDSISIVHTSEESRAVVFQMDDNGSDYAGMLRQAENPSEEEIEVYIDGELLYSRDLLPQEQDPPESGFSGGGDFGAIQMNDMETIDAARLATALSYPAKTPWPGERKC